MTWDNSQVPWTDEQWARVSQAIQEEADRARVAGKLIPLDGPLPPDADFVRAAEMRDGAPPLTIEDRTIIQLLTLQVKVSVRGAQMADPEMKSVLALFRRAANVLARLEDAIVFNGQFNPNQGPRYGAPPPVWEVHGGQSSLGLTGSAPNQVPVVGRDLVTAVSRAIGMLEGSGHFGRFMVALDSNFFSDCVTPTGSLVLPLDRILPFLGGGSVLRSSTLPTDRGVVVAFDGAPVELVIAKDVSLQFLQLTTNPEYVFRVYEKMVLRVKERSAIVRLVRQAPPAAAPGMPGPPPPPAPPLPGAAAPPPPAEASSTPPPGAAEGAATDEPVAKPADRPASSDRPPRKRR